VKVQRHFTGSPWEPKVGYCRAVRAGNLVFVSAASRWEEFGRAHAEAFGAFPPATTMIEVKGFVDPAMMIEVEVDAVAPAAGRARRRLAAGARARRPR
jgi:enamine deaminase RidA (YjgF/YER057c/UK114 family)